MKLLTCPTCKTPIVSIWRAAWFGAFTRVKCGECGDKLGFSYISGLVVILVWTAAIFPLFYITSLLPYYLIPPFIIVSLVFLFHLQPLLWNLKSYGKKAPQVGKRQTSK